MLSQGLRGAVDGGAVPLGLVAAFKEDALAVGAGVEVGVDVGGEWGGGLAGEVGE